MSLAPVFLGDSNADLMTKSQVVIYLHHLARVLSVQLNHDDIGKKLRMLGDELSALDSES